jgi:DNA-binding NarL/FixJ family response regulator
VSRDVILYDNQDITRIGIKSLIRTKDGMPILEVGDKISLIKELILHPDSLVILDYSLSDFGSVDELLNTGLRFRNVHWLLFSDDLTNDFLRRLVFSSESFSVVLKNCDLDEINAAIINAIKGERFLCNRITNQLLAIQRNELAEKDNILTTTEREILKEIALGKTTKEIASVRNLSFHTIITHRKNIFRKLDVNNVHEATKYAMRAGIIDPAEYII